MSVDDRSNYRTLTQVARMAFPAELAAAAAEAAAVVETAAYPPLGIFSVTLAGEPLVIPYRIYEVPPRPSLVAQLSPTARSMLHCLFTRHHDGRVRQEHVQALFDVDKAWVAPYVVALVGEYVVEVINVEHKGLSELQTSGSWQRQLYGRFMAENSQFATLTSRRVTSYWNCYYRFEYPDQSDYPGSVVLRSLMSAAAETVA